jgi:hypothetical protein
MVRSLKSSISGFVIVLFVISAVLANHHFTNTALASPPFPFFDPFTPSSQLTNSNISNEICGDGVDNDKNGLVNENCGSKSITAGSQPELG